MQSSPLREQNAAVKRSIAPLTAERDATALLPDDVLDLVLQLSLVPPQSLAAKHEPQFLRTWASLCLVCQRWRGRMRFSSIVLRGALCYAVPLRIPGEMMRRHFYSQHHQLPGNNSNTNNSSSNNTNGQTLRRLLRDATFQLCPPQEGEQKGHCSLWCYRKLLLTTPIGWSSETCGTGEQQQQQQKQEKDEDSYYQQTVCSRAALRPGPKGAMFCFRRLGADQQQQQQQQSQQRQRQYQQKKQGQELHLPVMLGLCDIRSSARCLLSIHRVREEEQHLKKKEEEEHEEDGREKSEKGEKEQQHFQKEENENEIENEEETKTKTKNWRYAYRCLEVLVIDADGNLERIVPVSSRTELLRHDLVVVRWAGGAIEFLRVRVQSSSPSFTPPLLGEKDQDQDRQDHELGTKTIVAFNVNWPLASSPSPPTSPPIYGNKHDDDDREELEMQTLGQSAATHPCVVTSCYSFAVGVELVDVDAATFLF
jgi:hypothetical protein